MWKRGRVKMTIEWLAGNRLRGTSTERTGATVAHATPTKIIDGNYTVLTYTADGKFIPKNSFDVEYLVVAGGGSGGGKDFAGNAVGGAGGGAGGFRTNVSGATSGGGASAEATYGVTAQSYTITVGTGGASVPVNTGGIDGGNSSIVPVSGTSIISTGGGGGYETQAGVSNGGSGGGGGLAAETGGLGTSGQGYNGGDGVGSSGFGTGGGGGSGSVGGNGTTTVGGAGGSGTANSITGSSVIYAGGGGGGMYSPSMSAGALGGAGGSGGGGAGGNGSPSNGTDATGYGSGGGGAGGSDSSASPVSGSGSNGIVIVRFLTSGNTYDVEEIGLNSSLQSGSVGGWHEVGRTTLGSAGTTIDVSGLADKRYYMVLHNSLSTGNVTSSVRLNGDSGNNYAWRYNDNGATPDPTPITNNNAMNAGDRNPPTGGDAWAVSYLANKSGKEKLMISSGLQRNTAGASASPTRGNTASKWTGTGIIDQITSVNQESGNWSSDSEMVVLGWDPADTHTTNFWEELADVTLGSAGTVLSSGIFTAKKYLWVQAFIDSSGGNVNDAFRCGNGSVDTGNNYSYRFSANGTADTANSSTQSQPDIGDFSNIANGQFINMFIVNNASNEKLIICHINEGKTGTGGTPTRLELVGKWANTSDQINIVEWRNPASNNYSTKSVIKVWGSD
jgi:hypothetical protein